MNTPDNVTGPINLGNPNEFSILELAEIVLNLCSSSSELKFVPLPSDDPKQRQPDISKARLLLGWTPKIPLKIGLKKSLDYYKSLV